MTLLEFCVEVVISCALSLFLYLALDYRVVSLVLKGRLVPSFRLVVAILRARASPPPFSCTARCHRNYSLVCI